MNRTIFFIIALLLIASATIQAQCNRVDSLRTALARTASNEDRIDLYNALAEGHFELGEIQLSNQYARQAYNLAGMMEEKAGTGRALLNQANIAYQMSDNTDLNVAINLYQKSLHVFEELDDKSLLAYGYSSYARFYREYSYLKLDEYLDSAALYYEKAYALYTEMNNKPKAQEVAGSLAEVFFEAGDQEKAFEYSEKSIQSTGTAFNKASIIQKSLNAQAEAQKRFTIFLAVGLGVVLILMFLFIRLMFETRQKNLLLEEQKANLATKNAEIRKQNELIEDQKQKIQLSMDNLQEQHKKVDKQYKQILLQQEEIEIRNAELGEKNEELKQQQEEILSQRDNLGKQALELEEQTNALQKSYETIAILSRIGQSITSTLDFQEVLNTFYGYVNELMPADGFRVSKYIPEKNHIEYMFNTELQKKKPLIKVSMNEDTNPAIWTIKNSRVIMINNKSELQGFGLDSYSVNPLFNSMIYQPLVQDGKTIGAVGVYSRSKDAYDHQHINTIKTLASYVNIALKNSETYEILNAAQEQLVESEKMAALGNLVAGVAHEINTPVGICVTAASRLDSKTQNFQSLYQGGKMKRKDLSEYLDTVEQGNRIIVTNLKRAADLVQGFKRVAVEQSSEDRRVFNLKEYLEETIMALNPEFKNKPYAVSLDADDNLEINSYAGAYSQIVTNLVMNSLIHGFKGREKGEIRMKARKEYNTLIFEYTDNGNGMSEEIKNRVFEPFFTTNRDGGGTGLGMNILYNLVVQKLGGKIDLNSKLGQGVHFKFEIPLQA